MKTKKLNPLSQTIWYDTQSFEVGMLVRSSNCGSYLLKDGRTSVRTVFNQECGIFINDALYIPLLNLSSRLFTAQEAQAYFKNESKEMPSLYRIICLISAVESVNSSLKDIALSPFALPQDVLSKIWYKEALEEATASEKRRCLIIESKKAKDPKCLVLDKDFLLFEEVNLYKRVGTCYIPFDLPLAFHWNGIDFFSFSYDCVPYYFFRRSDLKLTYLGKGIDLQMILDVLLLVDNILYQSAGGNLVKFKEYNRYYQRFENEDGRLLRIETGYYDQEQRFQYPDIYIYYEKDDQGLYQECERKEVEN